MVPALFPIKLVYGDSETHSTLSRGESIGLVLRTESGILSAMAASVILVLIFVSFKHFRMSVFTLKLFLAPSVQGRGQNQARGPKTCEPR